MNINLSTTYGGLLLKNPIVVGASNLVTDPNHLVQLEEAGAAAIVYKSLFEEQIELESYKLQQLQEDYSDWDAEHSSLFPPLSHAGAAEHLLHLREARKKLTIPLIGSLNCVHEDSWLEYALKMEDTGIDALELNFYHTNIDADMSSDLLEEKQLRALELVRAGVRLPLFVKVSPFYSNTLRMISRMDEKDVDGFVLFNRLFQPDIDIEEEQHDFPFNFSGESDHRLSLRYAGLLYRKIRGSIIANTGILNGKDVIKMILAGADAVQVVSAIYKRGVQVIPHMLQDLKSWMNRKKYASIEDFQGKLSRQNMTDPFVYKRAQYVDILMNAQVFLRHHPKMSASTDNNGKQAEITKS